MTLIGIDLETSKLLYIKQSWSLWGSISRPLSYFIEKLTFVGIDLETSKLLHRKQSWSLWGSISRPLSYFIESKLILVGIDPETSKLVYRKQISYLWGSISTLQSYLLKKLIFWGINLETCSKIFLVFYNFPMVYNFHTFESNYVQMIHCRMEPVVVKSGLRARAAEELSS